MEQKEYEDLVNTFTSDGWKYFVKSVSELEDALTKGAPDGATTNEQWHYARGQIHQLRSIAGYENYIRASWDQMQANQKEDNVDFV